MTLELSCSCPFKELYPFMFIFPPSPLSLSLTLSPSLSIIQSTNQSIYLSISIHLSIYSSIPLSSSNINICHHLNVSICLHGPCLFFEVHLSLYFCNCVVCESHICFLSLYCLFVGLFCLCVCVCVLSISLPQLSESTTTLCCPLLIILPLCMPMILPTLTFPQQ